MASDLERQQIRDEVMAECIAAANETFPDLRHIEMDKQTSSVTDHAVIRYLERVKGIDIERIRKEIETPTVRAALRIGASGVRSKGVQYVIKGGKIVTVLA